MRLREIKYSAYRRPGELLFASWTLGLGLWIAMPSTAFSAGVYDRFTAFAPEWQWGVMLMFVGLAHGMSIIVNGARWWTPLARAGMAAVALWAFAIMAYLFWATTPGSPAVYVYLTAALVAAASFYFAAFDCGRDSARWKAWIRSTR
jgi:peptidoglycan/LPS O-acetylase OafA/YrhL